ncbi:hypothetical protein CW697_10390 [Macrococcoides caseolyticum]|uniref:YopX family protein n=1 Tax=Macrococcoides caseolyticum TaxID=69966 RepID=UPI000C346C78|nr:YopX family protein [Macrococcus caseolyticus]PKE33967.1 hypothetical protein CW668_04045 [Macrococcus caseolyticus]PKF29015.1 hypothetical protein CW697_10390 [Macrococcus caseolyticus]
MIPKFRVWEHDVKFMNDQVRITYNRFGGNKIFVEVTEGVDWKDVDEKYLMQSTGLHDVNGKEIFEGDVVIARWWNIHGDHERVMLVEWNKNELGWNLINKSSTNMNYEIIGNIHEHSGLLEEDNKCM